MKVRLYKYPGAWSVDQFTLYFPYPKRMQEEIKKENGHIITGCFLGCSQDSAGGVIRCCWDDLDKSRGYNISGLGRRYPLEKMGEEFQAFARNLEKLYNDALKYDDAEHWGAWNRA